MYISERARKMEPSATLAVTAKAKSLKREGKPVISFGAGEPDFDSPPSAIRYAEEAMRKGQTHYTPGTGIPELRESICTYYKDHFGLEYTPANVVVGAGAKPLLFEALGCLVDPGDEVLVFTPAWVSYVEQIRLLGGKAVLVDTSKTDFIPRFDDVKKAITPRTRAMIVNNPNNPTGAVYDEQCLKDLGRLAVEHNIAILYDEIYERLVYGNSVHHQILNLVPEARDLTVIINGVSKAFAMTGWRIGYALGPSSIMGYLGDFQGHLTSNACSVAQWASVGALKEAEQDVQKMPEKYRRPIEGVGLPSPQDVFSDIFGGGRGAYQREVGRDIQTDIEITFEEMARGVKKEIILYKNVKCEECGGSGGAPGAKEETCPDCKGSGRIRKSVRTILGTIAQETVCDRCEGRGKTFSEKCRQCFGEGIHKKEKRITVDIPAGIERCVRAG
ncbi:MAG: aminotransferase class I/II-fold pyridoxal phosphate-dependent enzyme, partial [Synergistales bacterium]|nr:aminotransferase class I/II-fold pyridoxal phosphate-dependent enzyme [Synergistales bacterium]